MIGFRGLALNAVGQREEALGSFERAIGAKPQLAPAYLERANVLWRLHRYDEVLESIDKALARVSRLARAWHVLLHDLGKYDGALAAYEAMALNPDLIEAWLGRANSLQAYKRYEEAFTAYDKARDSGLAKAWFACGEAYIKT